MKNYVGFIAGFYPSISQLEGQNWFSADGADVFDVEVSEDIIKFKSNAGPHVFTIRLHKTAINEFKGDYLVDNSSEPQTIDSILVTRYVNDCGLILIGNWLQDMQYQCIIELKEVIPVSALINCPDCNKEVSRKAASCPHCGCPINEVALQKEVGLVCPDASSDLSIGESLGLSYNYLASFNRNENTILFAEGQTNLILHTKGIRLKPTFGKTLDIHKSQIINIQQTTRDELIRTPKSVIGRAAVGGLILGPLGAIIGGMSGVGADEKVLHKPYVVINYWDMVTRTTQTILLSTDINTATLVVREYYSIVVNNTPQTTNKGCAGIALILITIGSIISYTLTHVV